MIPLSGNCRAPCSSSHSPGLSQHYACTVANGAFQQENHRLQQQIAAYHNQWVMANARAEELERQVGELRRERDEAVAVLRQAEERLLAMRAEKEEVPAAGSK